ncbi:hypothetical protein RI367_003901 [Sorochytrium milnesiophthora]
MLLARRLAHSRAGRQDFWQSLESTFASSKSSNNSDASRASPAGTPESRDGGAAKVEGGNARFGSGTQGQGRSYGASPDATKPRRTSAPQQQRSRQPPGSARRSVETQQNDAAETGKPTTTPEVNFPYGRRRSLASSSHSRSSMPQSLSYQVYQPPVLADIAQSWQTAQHRKVMMTDSKARLIREAVAGDYSNYTLQLQPSTLANLDDSTQSLADALVKVMNANQTYKAKHKKKLVGITLEAVTGGRVKRGSI